MRLTLITVSIVALFLPLGIVQADTWIEDFAIVSEGAP